MNPNTRYPSNPSSSNNRYFHNNNNNEETLNQGLDLNIGNSRSYFDRGHLGIPSRTSSAFSALESDRSLAVARPPRLTIPPASHLERLPADLITDIGGRFDLASRGIYRSLNQIINTKDDLLSSEYPELKNGFRRPHRLTKQEFADYVEPTVCQEIAKQFLNPGCTLQDMHDLRNWTFNGLAVLISSPYLPIKNEKFMDNLAIAMENMPEEDSKKIYSVFTTEKSKAFPPGPPKNEGGPYRQYIQASEDSDILNCQYVQNLNNGLIDINSRDFEKNITISESSETFALHSKIASECNMNSVLERIADDSLSKLSNPNLDIAGPSINIVCNLLTNQHLNLIIFNKIKDNSSVPRHNLFLSRHCSPELINDSINQNPTSKMLYGAARGFNTFPETLKELVNHEDHEDPCVCAAAIQNPNTPLEAILEKLKKLNVNNELLKGETGNNPKVQKILTACFLYANQRMQRIKSSPSAAAGY